MNIINQQPLSEGLLDDTINPRSPDEEAIAWPIKDLVDLLVDDKEPSKVLKLGKNLSDKFYEAISTFLNQNLDVFAWTHFDMEGIDSKIMCHYLNIDLDRKSVRQKECAMDAEHHKALKDEVDKLLAYDFIKESFYPSWLANPVLVKKPNGKWRTCVDFTDLNKTCLKDSFPLPRIDQLVGDNSRHRLFSFMDTYSWYNQILMHVPDQEHTLFIIDRDLYCYKVMPFGLKNVGATYQWLVNMMFKEQINEMMEVYIDYMLVKSKVTSNHVLYLADTLNILRTYRMKLNPLKCAFGVAFRKFLRFMVNQRGIKANPEKIQALIDLQSLSRTKEE